MSWIGVALVYAWRYSLGLLTPAGTCKYHPSCSQYASTLSVATDC